MNGAIYNSRNPTMMLPSSRVHWTLCFCLLFSQLCFAADWRQPISQLVTQITAATGPGVVALEISNRSSISSADVEEIRRELTTALATSGVRIWQPDQAAANIKLTLSENVQDYVWVAQVQSGTSDAKVILVSTSRPDSAPSAPNAPPVTIHAAALVSQTDPLLDVAILESTTPRIVVLGRTAITIQEFANQRWAMVQS